ncbi:hypothetical protein BGZ75_006069 [Mortierella antarctica]|nr:hypothetical protein BGZ75_006069 [Mortierella antarctica]
MKTFHVLRRRHWILLVPVVNFVFLFLYVVSPTSLPRLPQFLSGLRGLTEELPYLWDLRKQVEGVHLTPLPDHLITTYRPKHLKHNNQEDTTGDTEPQDAIDRDNSTKYLTFLPHSGFHNQRTELENALLLARLLNRTLIMPKVYLGPPMPWLEFRHLHLRLLYQNKIGTPFTPVASEALDQHVDASSLKVAEAISVDTQPQFSANIQTADSDMITNDAGQDLTHESYDEDGHDWMEAEEDFEEEEEEENVPSWIEEPDSDEADKIRVATGDRILELDEDDDGSERESDDWDVMEDGEEAGYEEEEDLVGNRVGIMETEGDDEDLEPDWRPEVFTLPDYLQQQYQNRRSRHRQRLMAQRMKAPGGVASLPLYRPLISSDRKGRSSSMRKRSLPLSDQGQGGVAPSTRQQLHKRQLTPPPPPPPQQPEQQLATKPRFKWNPLPSECLQYETWTMTDWDLFFDLNPLRRYVRVVTRESMSMEYLGTQFGLEMPKEEDPPSNSTDLSFNSTESGYPFNATDLTSPTSTSTLDTITLQGPSDSTLSDALGSDTYKGIDSEAFKSESESESGSGSGSESESESGDDDKDKDDEDDKKEEEDNSTPDDDADTDDDERRRPLLRSEGDVLFFDDANLYDYRFTEDPKSAESKRTRSKYLEEFTVDWLAQRPERLIHLGSIFGSGRVIIETLQSKAWLQMIRDHLILRTDILQTTSQRIVDKIRGRHHDRANENEPLVQDPLDAAGFVGVHIRMSDGHFSLSARDTIENIRQELMWQMGITDGHQPRENNASDSRLPSSDEMGSRRPKRHERFSIGTTAAAISRARAPPLQQFEQQHTFPRPFAEEPGRRSNGRFTPIYLATDAHHPRSNPIFDRLFDTFECVFTLDDFAEDLEELRRFRNPEDGTLMTKFLIPMVDAMVVAKAGAFFGTPASTFSTYIQKQLRPAYTGLYD